MHIRRALSIIFTCAICLGSLPAVAQDGRDPTVAPADPRSAAAAAAGSPVGAEGMTVMLRDGMAFLVVGTRWYAPGDKVGAFRVERITETQVWLRDDTKLIKVPRFAGIERKSLASVPQCEPGQSSENAPTATPCEDSPP